MGIGGLKNGRKGCVIKKVLHHLLVCRTAVSVVFALKSGNRGAVEEVASSSVRRFDNSIHAT